MRNLKHLLLVLLLLLTSQFAHSQQVVVTSNLNLREKSTTTSKTLAKIPKGAIIKLSDCYGIWCKVSYCGHEGFIVKDYTSSRVHENEEELSVVDHNSSGASYYTNKAGHTVQSPTHYSSVPAGATAQCRDGSYSFSENRRGTCSHHGGVKRWLR
jgi:uncharacterized protein YraI